MARKTAIAVVIASLAFAIPAVAQQGGGTMGRGMMGGMGGPGMMGGGSGMMRGGFGMMSQYPDGTAAFLKTEIGITPAQEKVWAPFVKAMRDASAASARSSGVGRGPGMMRGAGQMGPGMMQGQQMGPGMMQGQGPGMMQNSQGWQPQPLPDALDARIESAQSRLDSLKKLRDAAKPLYAKLSDDQKAKADKLLGAIY